MSNQPIGKSIATSNVDPSSIKRLDGDVLGNGDVYIVDNDGNYIDLGSSISKGSGIQTVVVSEGTSISNVTIDPGVKP